MPDRYHGNGPKVGLCLEASHQRGMGHLFRCIALARAFEAFGATAEFYVNADGPALRILNQAGLAAHMVSLNESESGWETARIQSDGIGIWVNDRLDTDALHAERVRATGVRLATFDDRGTGSAASDINIVAFPAESETLRGRRVLRGIDYLILDPALPGHRRIRLELRSTVVSMGGSDTHGVTVDVVRALRERGLAATVILGPGFAHDQLLAGVLNDAFVVRRAVPSLTAEFALHDLAITAGGITPCEANGAGLPAVVIATEPWEVRTGKVLARLGGCLYAGPRDAIDFSVFDANLPIAAMSQAALATVPIDGAQRVACEVLALTAS